MNVDGPWLDAASGAGLLAADGTVGSTIFAEMSALAQQTASINLGQGFPDDDGPPEVLDAAVHAIRSGANQYPPGRGIPTLREAIAEHQTRFYGISVDPDREVLVTVGATEALAATLLALINRGDEVITFEPYYDAYGALISLAGGIHKTIPLHAPDFMPDLDQLRQTASNRTRIILVNSPHNPTGVVFDKDTLEVIVQLAHKHDAIIVTDEVYEHLTFGVAHVPIASLPNAAERTVSISSGGKTFSTTGWKIGWLTAPAPLITAITSVKQYLTYVSGTPFQIAIAEGLRLPDAFFTAVASELQRKRDLLLAGLERAGFGTSIPSAGYFIVADASSLGYSDAVAFCRELPRRAGVVAIPVSAFCSVDSNTDAASLVRFAFCKRTEIIEEACERLGQLRQ